jgi:hypothetical protein
MSSIAMRGATVLVGVLGLALAGCSAASPGAPAGLSQHADQQGQQQGQQQVLVDQQVTVNISNVSEAGNTFSISAPSVTGLYPGAVKKLKLTVANPYNFAIKVTDLWGALDGTSKPNCAPSPGNLTVRVHEGVGLPLVVPARSGAAAGAIPLYMPNSVVDGCQRATFTISLHGTAKKANGS